MSSAKQRLEWFGRKFKEATDQDDRDTFKREFERAKRDLAEEERREANWRTPEPLPELPPAPPLPNKAAPDRFNEWTSDIARCVQTPLDFPVIGSLVAAGAAISRRCGLRPESDNDFTAIPNLYGAVIGDPSQRKSRGVNLIFKPLDILEDEAALEHEEREIERIAADGALDKAVKKAKAAGGIDFLDDETREDYRACKEAVKSAKSVRRYTTTDSTVEKLHLTLEANPEGILVRYDELSHFFSNLRKQGREQERAFYLTAWNGDSPFTYERVGYGTARIPGVCVSLFGTIQPGVLSAIIREAQKEWLGSDGLLQRFQMLVYPEPLRSYKRAKRPPNEAARRAAEEVFRRLVKLAPETSGAVIPIGGDVPFLRFDARAQRLYEEWDDALQNRIRRPGMHPIMVAHLAKYASLMPSLALIYHLVDHERGLVCFDAAERAIALCEYLEGHATRIFAPRITPDITAAKLILEKTEQGKVPDPFSPRTIYRKGWTGLDKEDTKAAVDCLEEYGWVQVTGRKTGESMLVYSHPSIRTERA